LSELIYKYITIELGAIFESAELLLESILSSEDEQPTLMLPVTPSTFSELLTGPNLLSSSDEELQQEPSCIPNDEQHERVEMQAGDAHQQSTFRLNEEQLQNLPMTVGLASADIPVVTGI